MHLNVIPIGISYIKELTNVVIIGDICKHRSQVLMVVVI
jgi:hypothetical protein